LFFPVFDIPKELQDLPTPQPSDLAAKADQAMVVATRWNATLTLAILGLSMGAFFAVAESVSRGVAKAAWWRGLVSATIAGLFGAAGGLVASLLLESPQMTADMSPLARTISVQCLGLGLFGLGVGVGVGLTSGGLRLLVNAALGGLMGGLITGFLYPAGMAYLLPNTQTERVVPLEAPSRLVWLAAATLLTALVMTGLGRKAKRAAGPRTQ
jgi:hypothetical protein